MNTTYVHIPTSTYLLTHIQTVAADQGARNDTSSPSSYPPKQVILAESKINFTIMPFLKIMKITHTHTCESLRLHCCFSIYIIYKKANSSTKSYARHVDP